MNETKVFEKWEQWTLRPAPGCLLWSRYPTSEGPVEIWLPPNTTVAELTELVIPHFMKHLQLQVEWNQSVESFKERMAPRLTPEELAALYLEL